MSFFHLKEDLHDTTQQFFAFWLLPERFLFSAQELL